MIRVPNSETGREYPVPMSSEVREVMLEAVRRNPESEYVFVNPVTGEPYVNLKKSCAAACSAADIHGLHWHDLRHTFGTRLKESGVDPVTRRDLLGHASTMMTDSYTQSAAETQQAAVDLICQSEKSSPLHFPAKAEQPPRPAAVSA